MLINYLNYQLKKGKKMAKKKVAAKKEVVPNQTGALILETMKHIDKVNKRVDRIVAAHEKCKSLKGL